MTQTVHIFVENIQISFIGKIFFHYLRAPVYEFIVLFEGEKFCLILEEDAGKELTGDYRFFWGRRKEDDSELLIKKFEQSLRISGIYRHSRKTNFVSWVYDLFDALTTKAITMIPENHISNWRLIK